MKVKIETPLILSENKLSAPMITAEIPHVMSLVLRLSLNSPEDIAFLNKYITKKEVNCIRPSMPSKKQAAAAPQKQIVLYFPTLAQSIPRPKGEAPAQILESPRKNARHR